MDKIKKFFTKIKLDKILISLLMVVIGVLMAIFPNDALKVACIICGVGLIICALVELIGFFYNIYKFSFVKVVGFIAIAAWLFTYPTDLIGMVLNIAVGLVFIAEGGSEIQYSVLLAKNKIGGWIFLLIAGLLSVGFGIAMFFLAQLSTIFIGVSLAIDGLLSLIAVIVFSIQVRKIKKEMLENVEVVEIIA